MTLTGEPRLAFTLGESVACPVSESAAFTYVACFTTVWMLAWAVPSDVSLLPAYPAIPLLDPRTLVLVLTTFPFSITFLTTECVDVLPVLNFLLLIRIRPSVSVSSVNLHWNRFVFVAFAVFLDVPIDLRDGFGVRVCCLSEHL